MKITFAGVLADAWALFRRDADLLLRVAAPFLFLPAFALTLLVPAMPRGNPDILDPSARMEAWANLVADWVQAYGLGFFLAYLVVYLGVGAILSLYLDPARPDARGALVRTARLYPRLLLTTIVVSIPAGLAMWFLLIPGLYIIGRTILAAPLIVAERPIGVWRAIGRSLTLTRGAGFALLGLVGVPTIAGMLGGQPFLLLDDWLRGDGQGGALTIALVDAAAAGVAMATQLALTLIAVAAYRRLAG